MDVTFATLQRTCLFSTRMPENDQIQTKDSKKYADLSLEKKNTDFLTSQNTVLWTTSGPKIAIACESDESAFFCERKIWLLLFIFDPWGCTNWTKVLIFTVAKKSSFVFVSPLSNGIVFFGADGTKTGIVTQSDGGHFRSVVFCNGKYEYFCPFLDGGAPHFRRICHFIHFRRLYAGFSKRSQKACKIRAK